MKYFKNTSWLFWEKVVRMIVTLVVGVMIARYLGPSDYGELSYVLSIYGLLIPFVTFGVNPILVKYLVEENNIRSNSIISSGFQLRAMLSLVVFTLVGVWYFYFSSRVNEDYYIIIICFGLFFQSFGVYEAFFQARLKGKYSAIVQAIAIIIGAAIKITIVYFYLPIVWLVIAFLIESILIGFGYLVFGFGVLKVKLKVAVNFFDIYSLLKKSWPLFLASVSASVYFRIDQVMLKELSSVNEVGLYSSAVKVSQFFYFIPVVISTSLFPAILKLKSTRTYDIRMTQLYRLVIWLAICLSILLIVSSGWIIEVLFGKPFTNAVEILNIHIWSSIFVFIGIVSDKWLISEGLQKYALGFTLFGAIFNIVLNLFLIPVFGGVGAAFSTLVSYAFVAPIGLLFFKATRPNFFNILNGMTFNILKK